MEETWKSPKLIIGNVATGNFYYPRKNIVQDIWIELEKGNSLLLAAPRRVGKTSIMRAIENEPKEGFVVKFEIIQGVQSKEEFYGILFKLVYSCLSRFKKATTDVKQFLLKHKISEFDIINVKGKIDKNELNYFDEINKVFKQLENESEKIVLLLDELPEVLHNLHKSGKSDDAKEILDQLRVWRLGNYKNIQFVVAGSIGIHYVVKAIDGRTSDLNDLNKVNCEPLQKEEAIDFIKWATEEATIKYSEEQITYLLRKIQHYYTPYFINLMLDKIDKNTRRKNSPIIDITDVGIALEQITKENKHFEDWRNRPVNYMPEDDFNFVNTVLSHITHKDFISIQKIYDIAQKYDKTRDYMSLISELEEDGYLVESEANNKEYVFISPFLKLFWLNNNPIYND